MPIASKAYRYAFTTNKQSDIKTKIADAKLIHSLPMEGFAPTTIEFPNAVSDRDRYGKGHDFATWYDRITRLWRIPSRGYSLSPLSALYIPLMVMGKVTSSTLIAGAYSHKIEFENKATAQECIYTTLIEEGGASFKRYILGAVLNSFSLELGTKDHVKITTEGQARDVATCVLAMPDLDSEPCFFKTLAGTFTFGVSGAEQNISTSVIGGQIQVTQNPEPFWVPGELSADIGKPTYFFRGQQGVTGNLRVLIDSTLLALFVNGTECGLTITLGGSTIGATIYKYQVKIEIPHLIIASGEQSEEGQMVALTLAFNEQTVLKHLTDSVVSFTVQTATAGTELLVSG
jgi:hypothetical protein